METPPGHVLIAEDDTAEFEHQSSIVSKAGPVRVTHARTGAEVFEILRAEDVDLVIAEMTLSPITGLEILRGVKKARPSTLVILTARQATVASAVSALRGGVYDFLARPFADTDLLTVVERGLRARRMGEERRRATAELMNERAKVSELRRLVRERLSLGNALGVSPAIQPVYRVLEEVARTDSSVLITGESGTGKGVVARMIHAHSPRSEGPFIEANCVIYSEGVLQSELFGHERGAFTGAARQKKGRFELAQGGTIFLDEIGEISASIQLMLLRFLQEHRFERVGGEETIEVDVRVIAATNRELKQAMESGAFRRDLFYRLNVVPIALPPLRERREDIPFLTQRILEHCRLQMGRECEGFTEEAMDDLVRYEWPGNIRELENVVERTLVLTQGEWIRREDLPESLRGSESSGRLESSLQAREREHILAVLRRCGGNKKATAKHLGIHRSSLYSKLRRYGIDLAQLN